ncbi:unnamed protein product, partial [Gulo gulo]
MSPCSRKTSSDYPHSPEVLLMLNFHSSVIHKLARSCSASTLFRKACGSSSWKRCSW